jgi:hypothetical protein
MMNHQTQHSVSQRPVYVKSPETLVVGPVSLYCSNASDAVSWLLYAYYVTDSQNHSLMHQLPEALVAIFPLHLRQSVDCYERLD